MIFVFDFDLTLTTTHSGGLPKIQNDYFTDSQKIVIKNLFKYITSLDNSKIIILSRGHQQSIIEYVKNNIIFSNITQIIGAENINEISPFVSNSQNVIHWANRKTNELKKLKEIHPEHKIIYLDDTYKNIEVARKNNFELSFYVNNPNKIFNLVRHIVEIIIQNRIINDIHPPYLPIFKQEDINDLEINDDKPEFIINCYNDVWSMNSYDCIKKFVIIPNISHNKFQTSENNFGTSVIATLKILFNIDKIEDNEFKIYCENLVSNYFVMYSLSKQKYYLYVPGYFTSMYGIELNQFGNYL